jgi:hypothetical protein
LAQDFICGLENANVFSFCEHDVSLDGARLVEHKVLEVLGGTVDDNTFVELSDEHFLLDMQVEQVAALLNLSQTCR